MTGEATTGESSKEKFNAAATKYIPPEIVRNQDDKSNPYRIPGMVFQTEYTMTKGEFPIHTIHVKPCKAFIATDGIKLPNGNINSVLVHEETEAERLEAGLKAVAETFPATKPTRYLVFSATNTVSDTRSSDMANWRSLPLKEWLRNHGIVDGENAVVIVDDFWVERLRWTINPNGKVTVKPDKQYIEITERNLPLGPKEELKQIRGRIQAYNNMKK